MSDDVNNGINSGIALQYLNYIEPYVREIEGQKKEIASLKEQLKREVAAVDFYADRGNWKPPIEADEYCQMDECDEEGIYRGSRFIGHYSGKLARATQARREKCEK